MNKSIISLFDKILGPTYRNAKLKQKISVYERYLPQILYRIHNSERIKVVFFVVNVGMWKSDGLFKLLLQDKRFDPLIISYLLPFDKIEYQRYVQEAMCSYFTSKGYPFVESYNFQTGEWLDIQLIKPDLVFYSQPYDEGYSQYRIMSLWENCIFAYNPYCVDMETLSGYDNLLIHNIAWRVFAPTQYHKKHAECNAVNKGKNVVVTGFSVGDDLICEKRTEWEGWKQKDPAIKRVIWAPHHSIDNTSTLYYSNFLELADKMIELTRMYEGKIQFAFKPHPRLLSRLYCHPEWGVDKTNSYYNLWKELPNTIFVEGQYTDLFKSSDAMVHDCSSFMGEYLYTKRPVMFLLKGHVQSLLNDFGRACLNQHFIGHSIDDVKNFIDNVVLQNNDSLKNQREIFYKSVLVPHQGLTAAENMYNEIKVL